MNKYFLTSSLVALTVAATPMAALAHGGDHNKQTDGRRGHLEAQGTFSSRFFKALPGNSCDAIENKVDKVISRFDSSTDKKVNAYLSLKTKVAAFEASAQAAGYNTASLEAHMPELNVRIDAFAADYQEYVNALKALRAIDCDANSAQFQAQLTIARQLLAEARTSGLAVRDYFKTTIKADLQAIWVQIQANNSLNLSL